MQRKKELADLLAWMIFEEGHLPAVFTGKVPFRGKYLRAVLDDMKVRLGVDGVPRDIPVELHAGIWDDFDTLVRDLEPKWGAQEGEIRGWYHAVRAEYLELDPSVEAGANYLVTLPDEDVEQVESEQMDHQEDDIGAQATLSGEANTEFVPTVAEDIDIARYHDLEVTAVAVNALREALNLSKRKFGKLLGTTHVQITRWEDQDPTEGRVRTRPSGNYLLRMLALAADHGLHFHPGATTAAAAVRPLAGTHKVDYALTQ